MLKRCNRVLFSYLSTERTPSVEEIENKILSPGVLPETYLWAEVDDGQGWTYLVSWRAASGRTIRRLDVFKPEDEDTDWCINTYQDGMQKNKSYLDFSVSLAASRYSNYAFGRRKITEAKERIIKIGEAWVEKIEGNTVKRVVKGDTQ